MKLLRPEPLFALCVGILSIPASSEATFHLMQIEQIIGGVGGDTTAQAVQLRMRQGGEGEVSQGKLIVRDATGINPVILIDFTTNVSNESQGDRILVATSGFAAKSEPNAVPDFIMTAIPSGYLAGGTITFERNNGSVLWRVSWGNYSGPMTGETTNDSNGEFGPKFAGALPSSGDIALLFNGAASAESTNNAADYTLTANAAVFNNNLGCTFTADDNPNCGSTDTDGDGTNDNCDTCTDSDNDGAGDPGFDDNCAAICPLDGCPNDANKTSPGACGCGVTDIDSDNDGVPNCHDTCANTAAGQNVNAEGCACSQLTVGDSDGDGISNCDDECPNNPDPNAPGPCGCDTDPTDTDSDGTPDCADGCPTDPSKIAPGTEGCGVTETDTDGDLVPDASDNCTDVDNADQADADTDGVGDACEIPDDGNNGGCGGTGGCAPISGGLLPLLLLGNRTIRRRVKRIAAGSRGR